MAHPLARSCSGRSSSSGVSKAILGDTAPFLSFFMLGDPAGAPASNPASFSLFLNTPMPNWRRADLSGLAGGAPVALGEATSAAGRGGETAWMGSKAPLLGPALLAEPVVDWDPPPVLLPSMVGLGFSWTRSWMGSRCEGGGEGRILQQKGSYDGPCPEDPLLCQVAQKPAVRAEKVPAPVPAQNTRPTGPRVC